MSVDVSRTRARRHDGLLRILERMECASNLGLGLEGCLQEFRPRHSPGPVLLREGLKVAIWGPLPLGFRAPYVAGGPERLRGPGAGALVRSRGIKVEYAYCSNLDGFGDWEKLEASYGASHRKKSKTGNRSRAQKSIERRDLFSIFFGYLIFLSF